LGVQTLAGALLLLGGAGFKTSTFLGVEVPKLFNLLSRFFLIMLDLSFVLGSLLFKLVLQALNSEAVLIVNFFHGGNFLGIDVAASSLEVVTVGLGLR
jgi:hypothetical protein